MLNPDEAQRIFERVRKYADADEVELTISAGVASLTRFANNTIHQNVSEEDLSLSVRVAFDGKTARAGTNKLDDDSLARAARAATALAVRQEPDPDLLPMLSASEAASAPSVPDSVNRFFDSTRATGPDERAHQVERMVAVAKRHRQSAAGIFSISEHREALVNSSGLHRFHRQTMAEVSITMTGESSSGWRKANSPDVSALDPEAMAEAAARKTVESARPREFLPGKCTVILEPSAVLDVIGGIFWDFGALSVLEQRSFLNNRLAGRLFGENIDIRDDVYHPRQCGSPFDGEGMPRQPAQLVERGVVSDLVYARATTAKARKSEQAASLGRIRPTGHGFSLPNEMGEAPMNIVFASPAAPLSVEQMVAATERGILVTRAWYIREVDPYEKIVTGMTRDGTFLVENGKISGGLRNLRFNQSLIELLNKVEAMSEPVRASGEEAFDMVVPALKVNDFNFTEVTKF